MLSIRVKCKEKTEVPLIFYTVTEVPNKSVLPASLLEERTYCAKELVLLTGNSIN